MTDNINLDIKKDSDFDFNGIDNLEYKIYNKSKTFLDSLKSIESIIATELKEKKEPTGELKDNKGSVKEIEETELVKELNTYIEKGYIDYVDVVNTITDIVDIIRINNINITTHRSAYMPLIHWCIKYGPMNSEYTLKIISSHIKCGDPLFILSYFPGYERFSLNELELAINAKVSVQDLNHILDNLCYRSSSDVYVMKSIYSSRNVEYIRLLLTKLINKEGIAYTINFGFENCIDSVCKFKLFIDNFQDVCDEWKVDINNKLRIDISHIRSVGVVTEIIFRHIPVYTFSSTYTSYVGFDLSEEKKQLVIKNLRVRYELLRKIVLDIVNVYLVKDLIYLILSFVIVPRDEIVKILNNEYSYTHVWPYYVYMKD